MIFTTSSNQNIVSDDTIIPLNFWNYIKNVFTGSNVGTLLFFGYFYNLSEFILETVVLLACLIDNTILLSNLFLQHTHLPIRCDQE